MSSRGQTCRDQTDRGQAMVEYALVVVPLFLILMGIFDLGRAIYYYHMLSNAAREGARVGINRVRSADDVCAAALRATRLPNVPASSTCGAAGDLAVAVPQRGVAGSSSDPVRVTLSYAFRPITPLIGNIVGNPVTLSASSTMNVEY